jgi:hypothetical protein
MKAVVNGSPDYSENANAGGCHPITPLKGPLAFSPHKVFVFAGTPLLPKKAALFGDPGRGAPGAAGWRIRRSASPLSPAVARTVETVPYTFRPISLHPVGRGIPDAPPCNVLH